MQEAPVEMAADADEVTELPPDMREHLLNYLQRHPELILNIGAETQEEDWMAEKTPETPTREGLKGLVKELIQEVIREPAQQLPDPDDGLTLKSEVATQLRGFKAERERGERRSVSHGDLKKESGIE